MPREPAENSSPEFNSKMIELGYLYSKKGNWYRKDHAGGLFLLKTLNKTPYGRGNSIRVSLYYMMSSGNWLDYADGDWRINNRYLNEYAKLKTALDKDVTIDKHLAHLILERGEHGKCRFCGNRFHNSGYYCSEKCAKKAYAALMKSRAIYLAELTEEVVARQCQVCHKKETIITTDNFVPFQDFYNGKMLDLPTPVITKEETFERHHVNREPETTIILCPKCHVDVEKHEKNSYLRPEKSRAGRKRDRPPTNRCLLLTDANRRYTPEKNITWYRFNVMRLWSGLITELPYPFVEPHYTYSLDSPLPSLDIELRICTKCNHEFDGRYRTTCPKCRQFFR